MGWAASSTQAKVCGAAYGGAAIVGSTVYVSCLDGLHAVQVHDGPAPTFSVRQVSDDRVGPPIVSGGVIWAVTNDGNLEGYDQASGRLRYRFHIGDVVTSFPSLAASGGSLYVPAGTSLVAYRGSERRPVLAQAAGPVWLRPPGRSWLRPPGRSVAQAAGPVASVMVAWCDWPEESVQEIET